MRRPWLIALLAVLVGGGLWGIYEFSKPVQLVTSCELDDTLRAHKLTPENLVGAANEINELVDGGLPLKKRLFVLESIICDESLKPESRLFAIDVLLENVAILTVLEKQESLQFAWTNSITGTSGTVKILETRSSNGRVCSVLDYPSMYRNIGSVVIISARERYCRPFGQEEWFSDEIIGYEARRFDDPEAGPKQKT